MKKYFAASLLGIILIAVSTAIIFSMRQANAAGASWYVDNAAAGANNGTSWANAWQMFSVITWGGGGVVAGDTIYISGGSTSKTYTNTLTIGASGSSNSNRIWIRPGSRSSSPSGHEGTVIFQPTTGVAVQIGGYDYITLDGNDGSGNRDFQINAVGGFGGRAGAINSNSSSHGNQVLYVFVDASGAANNEHGVVLDNDGVYPHELAYSIIEDVWQDGIQSLGCSNPTGYNCIVVHDNTVRRISDDFMQGDGGWDVYNNVFGPHYAVGGSGHPDGFQPMGGYVRVYNNIWWSDYTSGGNCLIFIDHAFPTRTFDHIRIYNNVFTYNRAASYSFTVCIWGDSTPSATHIDDVIIANNTIVDAPNSGISIGAKNNFSNFTNIRVENNIIYNTGNSPTNGHAILLGPYAAGATITIDNNLIDGGNSGNSRIQDFTYPSTYITRTVANWNSTYSTANRTGVPSFVNYIENAAINNDYHLSSNDVVAMNLGEDLTTLTGMDSNWPKDKDGINRPQGITWDIGAYEYVEAAPPPPLKGDFNSDFKVNAADFLSLKNVFKNIVSALNAVFDLNSDSAIDVKDLGVLMSSWLP